MQIITPTPVYMGANPYIIDLRQLGKYAVIILFAGILIFLLLKIILDLRRLHYRD